jgi:hypothetical protein
LLAWGKKILEMMCETGDASCTVVLEKPLMALAQGRVPYSSRRPSATKARPSSCIIASLGFSNKTIPSFDSVHFRSHHDTRPGDPRLEIPCLHPNRKNRSKTSFAGLFFYQTVLAAIF